MLALEGPNVVQGAKHILDLLFLLSQPLILT